MSGYSDGCQNGCVWRQLGGTGLWRKKSVVECDCDLPKCPNYEICKNKHPKEGLSCFRGFCPDCEFSSSKYGMVFKKIEGKNECPVCFNDDKELYKLPTCQHLLCNDCFRKIFFTDWGKEEDYPEIPESFPHPPIGDEDDEDYYDPQIDYYENPDDEKWINDEAVQEWARKWKVAEEYEETLQHPINAQCPLCRAK